MFFNYKQVLMFLFKAPVFGTHVLMRTWVLVANLDT